MTKVIFLPGDGGSTTKDNWFPWLQKELEAAELEVIAATWPDPVLTRSSFWLPFLEELGADEDTILAGHSSGAIAAKKLSAQDFALKHMFVAKTFRGNGIAQSLLDALLLSFHDQKLSFFLSTKENEAIAAKKFYLKNGFVVTSKSELPINFPFFYSDDLFMRRDIG